MKEFRVFLAPLPDNGYLAPNSDETGHVLLVTDEAKSGYKAIEVTLKGYATVRWSETHGSGDNQVLLFRSPIFLTSYRRCPCAKYTTCLTNDA